MEEGHEIGFRGIEATVPVLGHSEWTTGGEGSNAGIVEFLDECRDCSIHSTAPVADDELPAAVVLCENAGNGWTEILPIPVVRDCHR